MLSVSQNKSRRRSWYVTQLLFPWLHPIYCGSHPTTVTHQQLFVSYLGHRTVKSCPFHSLLRVDLVLQLAALEKHTKTKIFIFFGWRKCSVSHFLIALHDTSSGSVLICYTKPADCIFLYKLCYFSLSMCADVPFLYDSTPVATCLFICHLSAHSVF